MNPIFSLALWCPVASSAVLRMIAQIFHHTDTEFTEFTKIDRTICVLFPYFVTFVDDKKQTVKRRTS
jgi:hypothetical protein